MAFHYRSLNRLRHKISEGLGFGTLYIPEMKGPLLTEAFGRWGGEKVELLATFAPGKQGNKKACCLGKIKEGRWCPRELGGTQGGSDSWKAPAQPSRQLTPRQSLRQNPGLSLLCIIHLILPSALQGGFVICID